MLAAPLLDSSEYAARRAALTRRCRDEGLDAIVVWSKGGHSDSAADVFYLANFYPRFNRSQAALVVPAHGEPVLFMDVLDPRRDQIQVSDVRFAFDLPAAVSSLLAEFGSGSRFGLVGGPALLAQTYLELVRLSAADRFVPLDDAVVDLRVQKSPAEIELIRAAAEIGRGALDAITRAALRPGTTEAQAVAAGYAFGVEHGTVPIDALIASGPASDYYCAAQVPRWEGRALEKGDLFHVDHAGYVGGYMFDAARSLVTGGRASQAQADLLDAAIAAVDAGIEAVRPGMTGAQLYQVVEDVLVDQGVNTPQSELMGHGHGIGLGFEWPFVLPFEQRTIQAGMTISVETMAARPGVGSVYFEQNVLVTEAGVEVLSASDVRYW
ncbi:M24 family metallopeptidase [Nocardioides soli]|uniref:Xaa-Pro aminopeptidase n=1 Tax=Nocardioides soli TaxID=1036020 RepID=A0A7W4W1Q8_9ACTN|nr:Xaa-Pro peptidase family protein [Nocardioides soli]MBB3045344.1 Xaa-Pro aminopeptidase [Nocardioides soli]